MASLSFMIFVLVYLGMAPGRVPGLALDRMGVALLGLIALLASGEPTLAVAGLLLLSRRLSSRTKIGALAGMALLSTVAGNLLLTGSLCNIIVAERAAAHGAKLSFMDFARSGIPMTLASIAVAVAWLWLVGVMRWQASGRRGTNPACLSSHC